MQEAMKNPHYKKIWERVMMNRHPKARTLEEALEMEKEYDDCILFFNDCLFTHNIVAGMKSAIIALKTANLSMAKIKDTIGNQDDCEILGRPITLEDILIFFSMYVIKKGGDCLLFRGECENQKIIIGFLGYVDTGSEYGGQESFIGEIEWQLTKPLHEQTPETWEKISNLID